MTRRRPFADAAPPPIESAGADEDDRHPVATRMPGLRKEAGARAGCQPFAIGRDGSADHSLQEPG